jgi:hypothetical protein
MSDEQCNNLSGIHLDIHPVLSLAARATLSFAVSSVCPYPRHPANLLAFKAIFYRRMVGDRP